MDIFNVLAYQNNRIQFQMKIKHISLLLKVDLLFDLILLELLCFALFEMNHH